MLSINSSISDSVALWPHAHTDALTWLVGGVVKLHVEGVPVVDDGFGRAGIVAEAEGLQRGVVAGGFGADGDGRLALPIGDGEVLVPVRGSCKRARGGSGLGGQTGSALRSVTSPRHLYGWGENPLGERGGGSPRDEGNAAGFLRAGFHPVHHPRVSERRGCSARRSGAGGISRLQKQNRSASELRERQSRGAASRGGRQAKASRRAPHSPLWLSYPQWWDMVHRPGSVGYRNAVASAGCQGLL